MFLSRYLEEWKICQYEDGPGAVRSVPPGATSALHPIIAIHLFGDVLLQVFHDLNDFPFGCTGLVSVPNDDDLVPVSAVLVGNLDVDVMLLSDLSHGRAVTANDAWVILGSDLYGFTVRAQHSVFFLF